MQANVIAAAPAADAEGDVRTAPEPATPRALWPTFMRRTLPEETLRELPQRPRYNREPLLPPLG